MTASKVTLDYPFGEIVAIVDVDGDATCSKDVLDCVLAAATDSVDGDAIHRAIPQIDQGDDACRHKCIATVELDEVTVTTQIIFTLNRSVTRQSLNDLVFGHLLPKIWETTVLVRDEGQPSVRVSRSLRPQKVSIDFLSDVAGQ